jgi:hypothetical protein
LIIVIVVAVINCWKPVIVVAAAARRSRTHHEFAVTVVTTIIHNFPFLRRYYVPVVPVSSLPSFPVMPKPFYCCRFKFAARRSSCSSLFRLRSYDRSFCMDHGWMSVIFANVIWMLEFSILSVESWILFSFRECFSESHIVLLEGVCGIY